MPDQVRDGPIQACQVQKALCSPDLVLIPQIKAPDMNVRAWISAIDFVCFLSKVAGCNCAPSWVAVRA